MQILWSFIQEIIWKYLKYLTLVLLPGLFKIILFRG